jgi:hypothetical protein
MSDKGRIFPEIWGANCYERTDPDYSDRKMPKLLKVFESLSPEWKIVFLKGLRKFEKDYIYEHTP